MALVEAYEAVKIEVNCERNDEYYKYGGAPYTGYDFYVEPTDLDILSFIQSKIREYKQPFISAQISGGHVVKKLWTREMIAECIKKGY